MKFLSDLFPVILFFVVFKLGGQHAQDLSAFMTQHVGPLTKSGAVGPAEAPILAATLVTIVASALQIAWLRATGRTVETMQWITLGIITVLGCATLFFNDANFIKWKPTVVYWALGSTLLFWQLILRRNALRALLGSQLKLPDAIYARLSLAWAGFFLIMGAVNLWVAFSFSTDTWVDFKLFGTLGATIAFVIAQSLYLARHMQTDADTERPVQ
jgi:intracellular septation protein